MKRFNKKQSGFTLLELLVVVSILAIIAGAVISSISGQEETAGQGVALHTMGALENATRQQAVLNGGLPSGLDSLMCADTDVAIVPATGLAAAAELGAATAGGLATGLGDKLIAVTVPADPTPGDGENENANVIRAAGITSLRYAITEACDDNDATTGTPIGQATAVGDEEADEVLANTLFWNADNGGAGSEVDLADGNAVNLLILRDPTDIGREADDIIAVFGVGNFSEMSTSDNAKIISRGPVDGNVEGEGEFYSHFSLAVKIGENATDPDTGDITGATYEGDEVEMVAILDSDGDNFDDEVAEFNGLEDE
jgi:prepilin-type N-terminal cleavage/methylation domain-containing protein